MISFAELEQVVEAQEKLEPSPNDGYPLWIRILAKALPIIGGVFALIFAIFGVLSSSPLCLFAMFLQGVAGLLSITLEASFCFAYFNCFERLVAFSEARSNWQKAALYGGIGITPIFLCPDLNTLLGGGLIFASGIVYGILALGKKADRNTMMGAIYPAQNRPQPVFGTFDN